jgi:hypothetical protein
MKQSHRSLFRVIAGHEQEAAGERLFFYGTDRELAQLASEFVRRGLEHGAAILIVSAAHRALVSTRLGSSGINTTRASRLHQYVTLEAARVAAELMANGKPQSPHFINAMGRVILQTGVDPVRIVLLNETGACLYSQGKASAALQAEELWNEVAARYRVSVVSAYPNRLFARNHADKVALIQAAGAALEGDAGNQPQREPGSRGGGTGESD